MPDDCPPGVVRLWKICTSKEPAARPSAAYVQMVLTSLLKGPQSGVPLLAEVATISAPADGYGWIDRRVRFVFFLQVDCKVPSQGWHDLVSYTQGSTGKHEASTFLYKLQIF